jgi:ferric-dicitrate binding protein FerR (iron transport regulator)
MTPQQDHDIDALLAKKLAAETDAAEDTLIDAWLAVSDENRRYWRDLQELWSLGEPGPSRDVDTEKALARVKAQIQPASGGGRGRTVRMTPWWMAAAAILVLGVVSYVYFWRSDALDGQTVVADAGTMVNRTLPDGSRVSLNPGSALTLEKGYGKKTRRMKLQGAATFAVETDSSHTFVVAVDDFEVQVLGTEFTVDNLTDPNVVQVDVLEGRVALRGRNARLELAAGQKAHYEKATGGIFMLKYDQQTPSRQFNFNATPLSEVLPALEKVYGVRIAVSNPALNNCKLQASYNGLPVQEVLNLIADAFSLDVRRVNGGYLLVGDSCGDE